MKMHWKFKILLCLLLSLFSVVNAQQSVPTVACMYCGGTGRAGYTFCVFCQGSGRMVDPQYQNQKAYELGQSLGLCSQGQIYLIQGLYSEAFNAFDQAMNLQNIEAVFFIGVCYELGMGVDVNHELAYDCYALAKKYGDANGRVAIDRINKSGYWPATEQTRQNFRNALKTDLEIKGNAAIMNSNNHNNMERSNNTNTRSSINCPVCHGTGRCRMCAGRGEWQGNDGEYIDCRMCHGGGQCSNCHGSGKLR